MLQPYWSAIKGVFTENLFVKPNGAGLDKPPLGLTVYAASGVINVLALALPITILQIYDRVLPNAAFATLTALIIGLLGVIVVDGILKYFRSLVVNWTAASFTHKLSTRALATMLSTPSSRYSRVTASEHLERLGAVAGLGNYIGGQSRIAAVDLLFIPIFAGVIILVGGFVFLAILLLFCLFASLAMRRTGKLNMVIEQREQTESRKYDFIIEVLRAMQTVKAQSMEPLMMRRFERLQSSASVNTNEMITLTGTAQTYNAMYSSLSTITIVGVGAMSVLDGRLTLGALACCMLLSSQLLQPLMRSLAAWNEIQLAKHRQERVASIFEDGVEPHDETQMAARFRLSTNPESVTLKNVTIQYGDSAPLFQGLDLTIPAGALTALRGVDGSGRTSLLRALMGDVAPVEGEIFIGEHAVYASDNATRSPRVRYIDPTPTTFRGTILENLTIFGELSVTDALWASELIGLHDGVSRMPLGYDTMLKSSAGKDIPAAMAQRICIARALATKPSVLILDEANALLDMAGEKRLCAALEKLRGKTTIIFATHRPSIIRMADAAYDIVDHNLIPTTGQAQQSKAAEQ